jgi:hypothetical protein
LVAGSTPTSRVDQPGADGVDRDLVAADQARQHSRHEHQLGEPSFVVGHASVHSFLGRISIDELLAAVATAIDGARSDCEAYMAAENVADDACPEVGEPAALVPCAYGSGHLGRWVVAAARLPAYDFAVDQRCDDRASAYTPRRTPLRDPIHLIGNGRGLVAIDRSADRRCHRRPVTGGIVEIWSSEPPS